MLKLVPGLYLQGDDQRILALRTTLLTTVVLSVVTPWTGAILGMPLGMILYNAREYVHSSDMHPLLVRVDLALCIAVVVALLIGAIVLRRPMLAEWLLYAGLLCYSALVIMGTVMFYTVLPLAMPLIAGLFVYSICGVRKLRLGNASRAERTR